MSDLCIYELGDNVWDEFSANDDHTVPQPGYEYGYHFVLRGDRFKKSESEIINVENNEDDALNYINQEEKISLPTLIKKDTMLEKDSCSNTPDGVFTASHDSGSVRVFPTIGSEDTSISGHFLKNRNMDSVGSEFCADNPLLREKCSEIDDNPYSYPLDHISQNENDLTFLGNDHEDKESSDPLYYGWPEGIGNFEEVDRMFRSCDSTFGLGNLENEDDLCWFSSSHSTERSDDALGLGSKFSHFEAGELNGVSEHDEASQLNGVSPSVNNSSKESIFIDNQINSGTSSVADHSSPASISFLNEPDTKSVRKDDLVLKKQMHWDKKQARHQNPSDRRRKDCNMENGSFTHNASMKYFSDTRRSSRDLSRQVLHTPSIQQPKQNGGSKSLNYMQMDIPFIQVNHGHSSDQISACPIQSSFNSENNFHPSPSPRESSHASNLALSIESSHGPRFEAPSITTNENGEDLYCCRDLQPSSGRSFKPANLESPTAFYGPVSVKKQACQSEYDIESQSRIEEVATGNVAEPDSSNVEESSCMSSVLDEVSLEATGFHQLQQVMEQLDIRTKLCIRDSLYRLAKSAEQRHNYGNASVGMRDGRDRHGALLAVEEDKTGFMDVETDTNPIDRSIAHLLFHRPPDPSLMPANDALSLKSRAMIDGSSSSSPVITMEQTCQEETAIGTGGNILMNEDKQ